MGKFFFCLFIFSGFLLFSCQKEIDWGLGNTTSKGSLLDDTSGNCLPKTVNGIYTAGTTLSSSANTIQVSVNVKNTGSFIIYSDTVNNFYFRATGVFSTTGINTVIVKGFGTPSASGVCNFLIQYDSSACSIAVPVSPAGSGGGTGPAEFTIQNSGNPASCSGATAAGTYVVGFDLNSTNTVTLNVNVTKTGSYSVTTTTVSGIYFSASGNFTTLGNQTLVLTGHGQPLGAAQTITIPVSAGASTCNFQVTTVIGGTFSVACSAKSVHGTYLKGVPVTSSEYVDITVDVLTIGPYNISVSADSITFIASGTFTATGLTPVRLYATGTPKNTGIYDFNLPGSPPFVCSVFQVSVNSTQVDWQFTANSITYKGTTSDAIQIDNSGTVMLVIAGLRDNLTDQFGLTLNSTSGGITTGNYSGTSASGKFATFIFTNGMALTWVGNPSLGTNLSVNLTQYSTSAHVVQGTFSGTVKDNGGSGSAITITNGSFKANFP
jgi:hypothetical protein